MISIFQKPRMLLPIFFLILFGTGLSSKFYERTNDGDHFRCFFKTTYTHIKKQQPLFPFQNSSPIILQNIFKYLNLEDFSSIQIAYEKSKSSILQKQFLKFSKTFSKKTLNDEDIFEFTEENISSTKQTNCFNFFWKPEEPIKFSNFIDHVMIYYEFRLISYIDGSFSIEIKNKNATHYISSTVQHLLIPQNKLKSLDVLHFLKTSSKQFLNFALDG